MAAAVTLQCSSEQRDRLVAELIDSGTSGLIEEDLPGGRILLRAFFEDPDAAQALARRLSAYHPAAEPVEAQDWVGIGRAQWKPLLLGERFFLVPPWCNDPAPSGRIRLEMPAGTAYGTGLHAPTQLMLKALERYLQPGERVLDLGTGSGILSVAAARLGAGSVVACDIEEDAVRAAREYAGARTPLFVGSVRSLRSASVDTVAANINAATIAALALDIARVLRPGGRALLSGFTAEDATRLARPLEAASLLVAGRMDREDWVCLVARSQI